MFNAWFLYACPLAISTVFLIIGVVVLQKLIRGGRDAQGKKYGLSPGCGGILLVGVGGTLCFGILLTSPTPWQRERLFDHVFRTPPERIERFVILPVANQYKPLTRSQVVIDDSARIRRIAEILRTSRDILPSHPRARWTAIVEMVTRDGTYYFSVNAPMPGDANGTLVSPHTTKEGGGWNLGDFRADGLDQVLEEAVNAARGH